jgi:ribosome modulation factor
MNTQEYFQEGVAAYDGGEPRSACPHPSGSDACEEWQNGWDEARHYAEDEEVRDNV